MSQIWISVGLPAQGVAAAGAPDALDELVDLEGDDDLFEIADRDAFFLGDALQDDGLVAVLVMPGEIDHEPRPIPAFGGKLDHAVLLRERPSRPFLSIIVSQADDDFNINL